MTKRNRIKGQTMIYKTLQGKLNIEQQETHKSPGWSHVLRKGGISRSTIDTRRVTIKRHIFCNGISFSHL